MTVRGAVNKTLILLALVIGAAAFTWSAVFTNPGLVMPLAYGGVIGALIVALVTAFKPQAAPITGPVYAVLEGLALGAVSAILNRAYPGVVPQAVGLTFGTLGVMLLAYQTGLVRATEKFKMGVVAATGAIALVYGINLILRMFGVTAISNFLWSSSPLSIIVSLVVVVVAALNLVLDFDLIEEGARRRAPLWMEWYAGYGLMVTLVWLYLEILRLLTKLQSRD